MRSITLSTVFFLASFQSPAFSQGMFQRLLHNHEFDWQTDTSSTELILYFQKDSWTASHLEITRQRILPHIDETKAFIGITGQHPTIKFFIVSSRADMKTLVGHETNGGAMPLENTMTAVQSSTMSTVGSNHEFFHVMAMNAWGKTDLWINEGMAVYADNAWHGKDLHALTKYLVERKRYVALDKILKHFLKVDDLISYPLMGSFTKYLDQTYGRDAVVKIWKGQSIQKVTGKKVSDLEKDWMSIVNKADASGIQY